MELYLPLIIPAGFGFIGSFGGITRIRGFAPSRSALLDVASSGPLYGASVSAAVTFAGLVLSSAGITDVTIDSVSFSDSFIMAVASQAFLGERLAQPLIEVIRRQSLFKHDKNPSNSSFATCGPCTFPI